MTYFTDSIYERMMVQKPKSGREEQPPAPKGMPPKKADKPKTYRDLIIKKAKSSQ